MNTPNKLRSKSVLYCTAKFNEKCLTHINDTPEVQVTSGLPKEICLLSGLVNIFAVFQFRACLRVTEAKQVKVRDILTNGSVRVQILKGGQEIVVDIPELYEFFIHCKTSNLNPFDRLTYKSIYLAYKKVGIGFKVGKNKNCSVTHAFRHLKADCIRNNGLSDKLVSNALHHRSLNSQQYYGKTTNKQSETTQRCKLSTIRKCQ